MPANFGQSARLAEKASRELARKTARANDSAKVAPAMAPRLRQKKRAASEMEGNEESCSPEKRRVRAATRHHRSAPCQSAARRSSRAVTEDSAEETGDEIVVAPRSCSASRAKRINSAQEKVAGSATVQRQDEEGDKRNVLTETQVVLSATTGPDPADRTPHPLVCRLRVYNDTATSPQCRLLYSAKFFLSSSTTSSSSAPAEDTLLPCGEIEAWRLLSSVSWDELLHLDFATIDTVTDERGECARLLQTLFLPSGALKDNLSSSPSSSFSFPLSTTQDLMHIEKVWIYDAFERQGLLEYVLRSFRFALADRGLEEEKRFDGVVLLAPGKFDDKDLSKCWKGVSRERVEGILRGVYERSGGFEVVVEEGLSEWFVTTVMGRRVGEGRGVRRGFR
ncbi:hypothetical protein BST61_g10265 [Cercospora zeina]